MWMGQVVTYRKMKLLYKTEYGIKKTKSEVDEIAQAVMQKIQEMMAGSNSECMFLFCFLKYLYL